MASGVPYPNRWGLEAPEAPTCFASSSRGPIPVTYCAIRSRRYVAGFFPNLHVFMAYRSADFGNAPAVASCRMGLN